MHIRRATFLILVLPVLLAIVAAYMQRLIVGLPPVPTGSQGFFDTAHPARFPHYINFLFIILLIRSGLQISPDKKGSNVVFKGILDEVDQLHNVSTRLEGLAELHPPVSDAILKIAGSMRSTATILAVVVPTKLDTADGDAFSGST
jgi:hypothetical protein